MPNNNTRLRKALKKVIQPQSGWLDVFPAVIGKADGTVETGVPGVIWVRNILNGQEIQVHNTLVPNLGSTTGPLQVEVGRRVESPNLWQVKATRETFSAPAGSGLVPYHFNQHVFPHPDSGLFPRKQIGELTVLVADAENFIVQVYGGAPLLAGAYVLIDNQQIDLSAHIPATGAVYVNIESDDDGVLTVNDGTPFAAKELATAADIPVPAAGQHRIATIILFETMEYLLDEHILVPFPLETNAVSALPLTGGTVTGNIFIDGWELEAKAFLHNDSGISFREQNSDGSFVWIKGDFGSGAISGYLRSQFQGFLSTSELITNGAFETGDFTGWTQTGSPTVTGSAFAGSYCAKCTASDTIKETITVVSGDYYLLEFAVKMDSDIDFHGIVSITNGDQAAYDAGNQHGGNWIRGAALIRATSTSMILEFKAAGGTNFVYFDNVTLKRCSGFSLEGMDSSGRWNVVSTSAAPFLLGGVDVAAKISDENIQDVIGAMVTDNTEIGIAVTYDDTGGKLVFSVTPAGVGAIPNDGWIVDANTWTFKNRTQAYTNDPTAGVGIVLNMTNTADFIVGSDVTVSSSAGSENTHVTAVVANTSITVNQLNLNHTTSSPLVTLLDAYTINADVTAFITKGTFLKYTQTTVKYGVVFSSTNSGGTTTIVMIHTTDFTLANAEISATYYSNTLYPLGFPSLFNYDPAPLGWSTLPSTTLTYAWKPFGKQLQVFIVQGGNNGTSNATTMSFSAPCVVSAGVTNIHSAAVDNDVLLTAAGRFGLGANARAPANCFTTLASGVWTATGGKRVIESFFAFI